MSRLDVSFPTLDGLTLRGWLYPASKRGPGIIVSPGVCIGPNPDGKKGKELALKLRLYYLV